LEQKQGSKPSGAGALACPWDLQSSKTAANYQNIGVSIQLDCKAIAPDSGLSYQYTQDDLNKILQALDNSLPVVKSATNKPTSIRLTDPSSGEYQLGGNAIPEIS